MKYNSIAAIIVFCLLCSNLFAQVPIPTEIDQVNKGRSFWKLSHGEIERKTRIEIPFNWDKSEKWPLMVFLHGGGASENFNGGAWTGFSKCSFQNKFIVAYPLGYEGHWNDQRKNPTQPTMIKNIDDEGFIIGLKNQLVDLLNIDEQQVFLVGVSNGATMTQIIALRHTDEFSGYASVIQNVPKHILDTNPRPKPTKMLFIGATEDKFVPYDGGWSLLRWKKTVESLGFKQSLDFWGNINGSTHSSIKTLNKFNDKTSVNVISHKNAKLYEIVGGGHVWPGGNRWLEGNMGLGIDTREIEACDEIWEFFGSKK